MSNDILDNDGLLPDLSFKRFLREYRLYFYTILNLLFFIFCISYIINPGDIKTAFYLAGIYLLNNLWLVLTYIDWRKKTRREHNVK